MVILNTRWCPLDSYVGANNSNFTMVFVGDISTINGIINQLITWGAPPCSYVTNYQRVQELFQCPFSFDSRGLRVQRLPWKQVFWGYPKGLKQPNIGNWLVVWNMNSMTFHEKLGISSSQLTSCHIFRRGRSTTNQGNDHFLIPNMNKNDL